MSEIVTRRNKEHNEDFSTVTFADKAPHPVQDKYALAMYLFKEWVDIARGKLAFTDQQDLDLAEGLKAKISAVQSVDNLTDTRIPLELRLAMSRVDQSNPSLPSILEALVQAGDFGGKHGVTQDTQYEAIAIVGHSAKARQEEVPKA